MSHAAPHVKATRCGRDALPASFLPGLCVPPAGLCARATPPGLLVWIPLIRKNETPVRNKPEGAVVCFQFTV